MSDRTSKVKVEKVTDSLKVGGAPHWDERVQLLYFASIPDQAIHKYNVATGEHTGARLEGRPGFVVPVEGQPNHFVVGLERKFVVVQWDGEEGSNAKVVRVLGAIDPETAESKIHDGKVDAVGRLFAGTMGPIIDGSGGCMLEKGAFYRLDETGVTKVCDKVTVSNGLAWDSSGQIMYYIDSWEKRLLRYDYDIETGTLSNLQYMDFRRYKIKGFPAGLTVDTEGNLWVAVFGGSCILQISAAGELLSKISIPAPEVTGCTFGGPNMDILFVTTARIDGRGDEQQGPPSGCTYKITGLGVKGFSNGCFKPF